MKIVIAPDSFKESVTATQAAQAIAEGVLRACPSAHIVCVPMADGGEGTVEAILAARDGERRITPVHGALGERRDAAWGWLADGTAIIEVAEAVGLGHFSRPDRRVCDASSTGVGELITAALDAGAHRIILGLGGSSTNDGGAGMIAALGARLTGADGHPLPPGGAALSGLQHIDLSGLDVRLGQVVIDVACDVDNPLCGPHGASHVFGPQKGATPEDVALLDQALGRLADTTAAHLGTDWQAWPGAGAAGGLGFAAKAFLNARFTPGVSLVAELGRLAQALSGATLAFTGEGRMDAQTLHGKTPVGVSRLAQSAGVPVVALAGSLGPGYEAVYDAGITAAFSLAHGPMSLDDACEQAAALLAARACDATRLWLAARPRPNPATPVSPSAG